ncbi:hypothetical protein X805_37690 [Sphaerotilus natans subsp. natans DSM 6575]|uniref:Uncharacterized protein n=1 Tax=Sphaerotilus natans subsp. natans DSM 6575 TaxID=1286631 RepID=A0A059KHE9_9BURK|nr:hypothetical protein X805_37690 [Sphaerotilus natans subsp. natans DSM 6575]
MGREKKGGHFGPQLNYCCMHACNSCNPAPGWTAGDRASSSRLIYRIR